MARTGNQSRRRNDYLVMDEHQGNAGPSDGGGAASCHAVRVGLSAMLDGEDPGVPVAVVRGHLTGCAKCRDWQARAEQASRLVRVRSAEPVPDLTAQVLAAVHADDTMAARRAARAQAGTATREPHQVHAERQIVRVAVAVAAVVQTLLALPAIWEGFVGGGAGGLHVSREMASFDVAVAVGFLLVALRPERARTYLPVALVLAACLALTTLVDVANGRTDPAHEAGHLIAVLQAGLLWTLARFTHRPGRRTPARSAAS